MKPVPCICGGKPHIKKYYEHHSCRVVYCLDCDREAWIDVVGTSEDDVIHAWNIINKDNQED